MGQNLTSRANQPTYGSINGDFNEPATSDETNFRNGGTLEHRSSISNSAANTGDHQYEELMHNSMTCPTCKGLGRVSRDQEDKLVAIIPLSDQRLKPRRTWLVILLTIVMCGLVGGLVLFFIVPRSIVVDSLMVDRVLEPLNVTLEEFKQSFKESKYRMNISFTEPLSLTNDNFFPVDVTRILIEVNHAAQHADGSLVLSLLEKYDNSSLGSMEVPLRSSSTISSDLSITLDSRLDVNREGFNSYLIRLCMENPSVWSYITLVLNTTVYYRYLGNTQRQTLSYDRHIGCYPYDDTMPTFPTTEPTTTKTTTTPPPLNTSTVHFLIPAKTASSPQSVVLFNKTTF